MKIKKFIKKDPFSAKKSDTVQDVARKMKEKKVAFIIVVERGRPVGIVTDQDIVWRVVAKSLDIKKTKVEQIMAKKVYTVTEDDVVSDVYRTLLKKNYRHAPVVKDNKLYGMVSLKDLAKGIEDQMIDAYFGSRDFSGWY